MSPAASAQPTLPRKRKGLPAAAVRPAKEEVRPAVKRRPQAPVAPAEHPCSGAKSFASTYYDQLALQRWTRPGHGNAPEPPTVIWSRDVQGWPAVILGAGRSGNLPAVQCGSGCHLLCRDGAIPGLLHPGGCDDLPVPSHQSSREDPGLEGAATVDLAVLEGWLLCSHPLRSRSSQGAHKKKVGAWLRRLSAATAGSLWPPLPMTHVPLLPLPPLLPMSRRQVSWHGGEQGLHLLVPSQDWLSLQSGLGLRLGDFG